MIAPLQIRVADVHAKANPAGNAIHRARKHFADAYSRNRVNRPARASRSLNRQNQLRRRAESIAAIRHQYAAGMSARSPDRKAKTSRRRDLRDNAQRNFLPLQHRPLLNVQFDKRVVVAPRQLHLPKFASEPSLTANFIDRDVIFVFQFPSRIRSKRPREQPAPQASNPKPRRLFRSENQQLNRTPGTKSTLLQSPNRFQPSQHSHHAIVLPSIRNRIDVRARAYNPRSRVRAIPSRKSISDRIVAHRESRFLTTCLHPRPRFEIRRRENNSRHRGRFRVRERSQSFDLRKQSIPVDSKTHGCSSANGCRFQSL